MLGLAVVDHRANSDAVAIWLTTRISDLQVEHSNAVTVDVAADPDGMRKVFALTRDRSVLLTDKSTADGLPINSDHVLSVSDVTSLVEATVELQKLILEAIAAHKKSARVSNLVEPVFAEPPTVDQFVPADGTATQRAFQTANFALRAWSVWLKTDDERRRRSFSPRSKTSPWIMPNSLSSVELQPFPAELDLKVVPEPPGVYVA